MLTSTMPALHMIHGGGNLLPIPPSLPAAFLVPCATGQEAEVGGKGVDGGDVFFPQDESF